MPVVPVPCFQDNYAYLVFTEPDVVEYARIQGAVAIDPASVFAMLRNRKNVFKE